MASFIGLGGEANAAPEKPQHLLDAHSCTACHAQDSTLVGPSFNDIAKKHPGKADYLVNKIKLGSSGVWGDMPMPPQSAPDADIRTLANWLANGAK